MTEYDLERLAKRVGKINVKLTAATVAFMFLLAVGLGAWLENIASNLRKVVEVHTAAVRDHEFTAWVADTAALNTGWTPGEFRHQVDPISTRFFQLGQSP